MRMRREIAGCCLDQPFAATRRHRVFQTSHTVCPHHSPTLARPKHRVPPPFSYSKSRIRSASQNRPRRTTAAYGARGCMASVVVSDSWLPLHTMHDAAWPAMHADALSMDCMLLLSCGPGAPLDNHQ
eukprot:188173-Chlamydomonas_euryale.AAC.2